MRSFSFQTILGLCFAILVVDILAFYWLLSITRLVASDALRLSIHVLFWFFTVGLITAILVLKSRLDHIHPKRKTQLINSLYGLTVSSFIPKVIFVIMISTLYLSNYAFSEAESIYVVPLTGLFSGLLPFAIVMYAILKAAYRFKVYHIKIQFSRLPKSFHGTRIVQISDIHLGNFNRRYYIIDRARRLINRLHPDYVFFTGDLINNYSWETEGWVNVFKKIDAKYGKFAVLGNHDYGDYGKWPSEEDKKQNFQKLKEFFDQIDFELLLNESCLLQKDSESIGLIGVENWSKTGSKSYGDLDLAIQNTRAGQFLILLSHDPDHWESEVIGKSTIDLTLSGHTHGMQAGIQLKNKNWSPIKYKHKHWAGLYREGDQYLYVNRGLGWLGFPGRIGMRPEITFIELLCE